MDNLSIIKAALSEDMPKGDITTDCLALTPRMGRAKLRAKSDLVLSGFSLFEQTLLMLEPQAQIKWHFEDGQKVLSGQNICVIHGDLVQILKAERVALNFAGHLSGIATLTSLFVEQVQGAHPEKQTIILDTRKTTPGYRQLQKRAVVHGGGQNHRQNLSDGILIKDNHIAVMGGIEKAVRRIRTHSQLPIEVEAGSLEDVRVTVAIAEELGVHRVLLDNMDNALMAQALRVIPQSIQTEASGNMSLDRVRSVAALGVDFISVGALTHSAPSADLSLQFEWERTL